MKKLLNVRSIWYRMHWLVMVLFLVLGISTTALAKAQLDAGQIIGDRQERQATIPDAHVRIEVAGEQTGRLPQSQGAKIKINHIQITGQSIYSEDVLLDLVEDVLGKDLTLAEIEGLAERITAYLHEKGYLVAVAYIPAQEVKAETLEIRVVIGQYDSIVLNNHSHIANDVANKLISTIKAGDYVKNDRLERTLLLLNDIGGVSCKGTLAPGKRQGTTELIIELNDAANANGKVTIDNYGSRFTGQNRANVALNISDLPSGDSASISATTAGRNYNDMDLGYSFLLGNDGAKAGIDYYQMHYTLGKEFASLNAKGDAKIVSLYSSYPIVRSRNYNLYARMGYEHKSFQDIHTSQNVEVRNNQANVWSIGLSGDSRDRLGGGGINSFAMNLYSGHINTNDSTTSIPGSYTKTVLNYNRLQYITKRLNFLLGFSGQLANKDLDSAEKFFISGPNGIKAYPQGAAYGDEGYLLTGELLWNMPTPAWQVAVYFEQGRVIDKAGTTYAGGSDYTLSGAGLGVIYNDKHNYSLRLDYAWPVSADDGAAAKKEGRFWLKGSTYF